MKDNDHAIYFFHEGTNYQAYKYFGAHKTDSGSFTFRTWAPNADEVCVVGDFNSWGEDLKDCHRLNKISEKGIWETECEIAGNNDFFYKFMIKNKDVTLLKSDPFAFFSETDGKTASIFRETKDFEWEDDGWINYTSSIKKDNSASSLSIPINIYEVHLGSFYKDKNNNYIGYREYANILSSYVKEMGYTHIELMPICEHPFGGSWGYQITGYFAPTSRYGTPEDFKYFVNEMHKCGVGVILDWVPGHFPKDESGLSDFDGGKCYEYQGEWKSEHREWGTKCFDVGRPEVQSFLISSALYWIEEYHIDGLRVDAVASMLYLDYNRKDGEWVKNTFGTNENLEAIAFFKKLNSIIHSRHPRIIVIAEESTEWKNVTSKEDDFGLGFDLKWNMGWMHDTLDYCSMDSYFRSSSHDKLTFSFFYAFSERFVLPISHDEVVYGKKSLLDKFFGNYDDKFLTYRVFMSYMMSHPGKKMLFMGCEYGQFAEWDYKKGLEWFMIDFDSHRKLKDFVRDINHFYLANSELWEIDFTWEGFKWIVSDDNEQNIIAYERINLEGSRMICVLNFSPISQFNYRIGVEEAGDYEIVFSSNGDKFYNDRDSQIQKSLQSKEISMHSRPYSLEIDIPRYTGLFLRIKDKNEI